MFEFPVNLYTAYLGLASLEKLCPGSFVTSHLDTFFFPRGDFIITLFFIFIYLHICMHSDI